VTGGPLTGAWTMVRRRCTSGGALPRDGDGVGMMRTRRRRVGGVGIFTGVGVAFYRAEARRGRAGVPSWPVLEEVFNAMGYWKIGEGRGHHLMGEMKRRKCGEFFLQQRWPKAAIVAA
jgi:hypothetical protein